MKRCCVALSIAMSAPPPPPPPAGRAPVDRRPRSEVRAEARRIRRRRQQIVVLSAMAMTAVLAFLGTVPGQVESAANEAPEQQRPPSRASRQATDTPSPAATGPTITYPAAGPATYVIAPGQTQVAGTSGELLRYRVQVENGITNLDPRSVADLVDNTLADRRSWTAGREWRFQRISGTERPDFTLFLVTPATRDKLCEDGVDGYTSCRKDDKVVLNVARWVKGVPHIKAPIQTYRQYAINHEVGHRLTRQHETCPGAGKPAPVMQQQTLGLHGCTANAWPFPDGKTENRGPDGSYPDPIPRTELPS